MTDNQVGIVCKKPLTDVILSGKKQEINLALREFKDNGGILKYDKILSIPFESRITKLAEKDYRNISMVLSAALHLAFESMNLKRNMTADQEIDLAEAIIDTSAEDYLAVEDVMIFLQNLTRGEYGALYESMDIPKFMDKFEIYRQKRYQALQTIKNERHTQAKVFGDNGRTAKTDQLSEHFASLGDRLSGMKSDISRLKDENKNLKMDNF